jgi:hypothetical protein
MKFEKELSRYQIIENGIDFIYKKIKLIYKLMQKP